MKKILAICGSLAANSVNLRFLRAMQSLTPAGWELQPVTLHTVPMFTPDSQELPELVQELCTAIGAAERLVIASPEYNYSLPGVLKNTLDWVSRDPAKPLNDKPVAIMGASPGMLGTVRMQSHLRQVLVFFNVRLLNKPEVFINHCNNKIDADGVISDAATAEFLRLMLAELVAL